MFHIRDWNQHKNVWTTWTLISIKYKTCSNRTKYSWCSINALGRFNNYNIHFFFLILKTVPRFANYNVWVLWEKKKDVHQNTVYFLQQCRIIQTLIIPDILKVFWKFKDFIIILLLSFELDTQIRNTATGKCNIVCDPKTNKASLCKKSQSLSNYGPEPYVSVCWRGVTSDK